jgi:hypothetical protein
VTPIGYIISIFIRDGKTSVMKKSFLLITFVLCFCLSGLAGPDPNLYVLSRTFFQATSHVLSAKKPKKTHVKKKPVAKKPRVTKSHVTVQEAEARGVYDIINLYINDMCIKEVPFFLSLHRSFYKDERLLKGDTLVLAKLVLQVLKNRAVEIRHIDELRESSIKNVDSMYLYKEKKNRKNESLCNFAVFVDPGAYEMPKTGASVRVPEKIAGSLYYNSRTGKMVVYVHTMGIKLELPAYAKALTLGLIGDMDLGFAEIEREPEGWKAVLLYTKEKDDSKKTGWSFNVTECNKIRPCSEE